MKRVIASLFLFVLACPAAAPAEPSWWIQQKRECGISTSYETWKAQGMPCRKGGGSSGALSPAGELGAILGTAIGNSIADSFRGNSGAAEARKVEPAVPSAEEKRAAEERAAELARLAEEAHAKVVGSLQGLEPVTQLGLMGFEDAPDLQPVTGGDAQTIASPKPASTPPSMAAVAEKQMQALGCAVEELREQASGMGEEGGQLRTDLAEFLGDVRAGLSRPCSGQPDTRDIRTLSLGALTRKASGQEGQLSGSVLVSRDEKSCEVFLSVLHAASSGKAPSPRPFGKPPVEGQSVMHLDGSGRIIASENPARVDKCLARRSAKGP